MDKIKVFDNEIKYIYNDDIKNAASIMIGNIADYFFTIPASSTGKYHPEYASGEGGLVRHTKAAVRIAYELFNIYKFPQRTKDLIIMALILHDSCKKGIEDEEKYTRFDHPLIAGDFIKSHEKELGLPKEDVELVCNLIASHMGRFNTDDHSNIILPLPQSPEQKFVHMCDFLASRKVLKLMFNDDNNVIDE